MNREQIEERIFDYHEGNLNATDMKELESFIASNPEYQVDFDAWKESYFSEEDEVYPFADQLVAGSGGAWMKWSVIALLLLGSAYGINYISNSSNNSDTDSNSISELRTVAHNDQDDVFNNGDDQKSVINNQETEGEEAHKTKSFNTEESDNDSSDEEAGTTRQASYSYKKRNDQNKDYLKQQDSNDKSNKSYSSTKSKALKVDGDKTVSKQLMSKTKVDNNIALANAQSEVENGTKRFKFKNEENVKELNNLALAQAMNFFDDGRSIGGANARSYKEHFPNLELNNISLARKSHKESGLARIIKKLSDGFRMPKNLGLRNFRDPYLVIPEYHSPLTQIGAFTGSNPATRAKLSFRSSGNVLTGSGGLDARLSFGKQFALGIGGFAKVAFDDNELHTLTKQDYSFQLSPKFDLGRDGSIEAGININSSIISGQAKNLIAIANPKYVVSSAFDRQGIFHVANHSESDTITSNNVYVQTFDVGGSFIINTDQFYAGIAMDNILGSQLASDKVSFEGRSSLTSFTAVIGTDYQYSQTSNSTISPSLMIRQTGKHTELWMSANARFNKLMFGLGYGNHGEAAAVIGIQTGTMRFGITTDYTKSILEQGRVFSFGATLRLFLGKKSGTNDLPKT